MKTINRVYPLTAFLVMILFSQASNAIVITSYTGFWEDGSKIVVDLKGYDYGAGSHYASQTIFFSDAPPIENFDTFFYPSWHFQKVTGIFPPGGSIIEGDFYGDGLYFTVDEYYGVSMSSFQYNFSAESSQFTSMHIYLYQDLYTSGFSGGFFKTYTSPYQVDEPGTLALIIIGIAGLGWARQRRKTQRIDASLPDLGDRLILRFERG